MTKKSVSKPSDEERLAFAEQHALASLALVLADAMEASGLTQRKLASRLGLSEARISQILSADGNPTVKSLARLADALDCRLKIILATVHASSEDRPAPSSHMRSHGCRVFAEDSVAASVIPLGKYMSGNAWSPMETPEDDSTTEVLYACVG